MTTKQYINSELKKNNISKENFQKYVDILLQVCYNNIKEKPQNLEV